MRKRQRNPVVINNVLPLGKGEVACSNHAGSTIFPMLNNVNPLNTQAIVMFNIR